MRLKMIPHNALIILRDVSRVFFLKKKSSGPLPGQLVSHHQRF